MTRVNMPQTVEELEQLFQLIILGGETVVVEKDGRPIADITPREQAARNRFGSLKGTVVLPEGFDAWFDQCDKDIEDAFEEEL